MSFSVPPELTTALTDLAIIPFAAAFFILIGRTGDAVYRRLWRALTVAMSVSGFGGFVVHGIVFPGETNEYLWLPLQTVMLVTVILFACVLICDISSKALGKAVVIAAVSVFAATAALTAVLLLTGKDYFSVFLITAALCVGPGLIVYPVLMAKGKRYAGYMFAGVLIQGLGMIPRILSLPSVFIVWEFDKSSMYHVAAIVSLCVFCAGVLKRGREKN